MRHRNEVGEYSEEPGTVLCRKRARRYAHALRIAMAVHNHRGGCMEEIARRIGYSRQHVSLVLASKRSPTERFLECACEALGCDREILDVLAGEQADDSPVVQFLIGRLVE